MSKSAKNESATRENTVQGEGPGVPAQGARRHLLGFGLPAAAAFIVGACGSFRGAGVTKDSKPDKAPNLGAGAGAGGGTPKGESGDPDTKEPGVDNPTTLSTKPAPCDVEGPGIIALPGNTPPGVNIAFKAYGDTRDTMVVLKAGANQLMAGDFIVLARVLEPSKGKVLARRRVTSLDLKTRVIIFDGLQLGKAANPKLTAVVVRGLEQKRSADFDVKFESQIAHPMTKMGTYEIIDAFSMRQTSASGPYKYFGLHENYFHPASGAGPNKTVCLAFGDPSGGVTSGGQTAKAGSSAGRPLKKAVAASTWTIAPSYLPYGNAPNKAAGQDYYVCDAFGDPLPGLAASHDGKIPAAAVGFLQDYATVIVYVLDGDHFHRYFFNVG